MDIFFSISILVKYTRFFPKTWPTRDIESRAKR